MSDSVVLRRCPRCNLKLVDKTIECPLCHGVVETEDGDDIDRMDEIPESVTYPDVSEKMRLLRLFIRIVIFAAIVAMVTVCIVNYYTFNGVYWSLIVVAGLLYCIITLLYCVRVRRSMQRIIQVQMWLSMIFVVILDHLLGYKGWSFEYAIPITLVAIDVAMVVFMILGIRGWQSYIMTEIVVFVVSIVLLILGIAHKVDGSTFTLITAVLTGFILLGTVMFGSKKITNEITRRFMI